MASSFNSPGPAPAPRMRARLSWLGGRQAAPTPAELDPVIRALETRRDVDIPKIVSAFEVARMAHEGQMRKSGEPYITHPVAVATIIAELGMGTETIIAALLHDVAEDTEYPLEKIREEFGETVALIVDGVTKLDKVTYGEAAQAETVRKMVVAMARDIRVLMLKLADRLHNARTWKYVERESAARKARETLEIYAPLAHRLGMNSIKWELEDLSFQTLYPKVYEEIEQLVAERAPEREKYLQEVSRQIEADLRTNRLKGTVTGRPKHYYSIYQKMIVRGREFDDIFDLVGIRVLVETEADCYAVLGYIHKRYKPIPGRFKDYISLPKFNLYQSVHTTVIGPRGRPIEIQIRTYEMHKLAEFGVAAHWRYKSNPNARSVKDAPKTTGDDFTWLRQIVDWQRETADPSEFLDSLRYEMANTEVYVYTPRGDVIALPAGSTPIDFAYQVHTEVGHRTVGAKVNGRLVPLATHLESGDTVEIITSKDDEAGPRREWLDIVASGRARTKIKQYFTRSAREENIDHGRDAIVRHLRKQNLPIHRLMSHDSLAALAASMGYDDVSALYAAVGEDKITPATLVDNLVELTGGEQGAEETLAEATTPGAQRQATTKDSSPAIVVEGLGGGEAWVKLARCCTPVPGDAIRGYVTRGSGISVHRADCANLKPLANEPERFVDVAWSHESSSVFLVQLQVEALDRGGLLSDVTRVVSEHGVNILSASVHTNPDRIAISRFLFEMADASHLSQVIASVKRIEGVLDAYRYTGTHPKPRHKAKHRADK